jgi:hypothetical protein
MIRAYLEEEQLQLILIQVTYTHEINLLTVLFFYFRLYQNQLCLV